MARGGPGLDGVGSLESRRARLPDRRVAILTGQARSEGALRGVLRLSDAFLEKPFRIAEIVEAVRALVAPPASGGAVAEPDPEAAGTAGFERFHATSVLASKIILAIVLIVASETAWLCTGSASDRTHRAQDAGAKLTQ